MWFVHLTISDLQDIGITITIKLSTLLWHDEITKKIDTIKLVDLSH